MDGFEALRRDLAALLARPGHITRAEVEALLARHPSAPVHDQGAYADARYDPRNYG